MTVDVSISANSQPTRAVESYHLVAYYTQRRDECLVDRTNFLMDNFSVNKSAKQFKCIFISAFIGIDETGEQIFIKELLPFMEITMTRKQYKVLNHSQKNYAAWV